MTRRFTRLAWLAATCTYLLIVLGAIVRITGSGLGCGEHWPLCNGRLLPLLDLPTLIEYGHRLAPGLAPGVSGDDRRSAGLRDRLVRRPHREPRRRQRVSRIPVVQRSIHSGGELPAARPLDAPTARVCTGRICRLVGAANQAA